MKKLRVNTADTSHKELAAIAKKCGFEFYEGGKHTKVKTKSGEFVTEIPRHNPLNKHTARGIAEAMNAHGAGIEFS